MSEIMKYDKDKMKEYLFNSPSYKHINTFLPAIVNGFDVKKYLSGWLEKKDNLKFLHCMELIEATREYDQQEYQNLLKDVMTHNPIKVEDWCTRTKGRTLLSINDQVFVTEYVVAKIAFDLGDDDTKQLLQDSFEAIYESDKSYECFLANNVSYSNLDVLYKWIALHLLAEADRYWISLWYQGDSRINALSLRASLIAQVFSELL